MKLNLDFSKYKATTKLREWWKIVKAHFEAVQSVHNALEDALAAESGTRQAKDAELNEQISTEELAREDGDSALGQSVDTLTAAVSTETAERKNADNKLQSQLDSIKIQNSAEDLYGKVHTIEVTLPAQIPSLYIHDNDFGTMRLTALSPTAVIKKDGEPLNVSMDSSSAHGGDKFDFEGQGDVYITGTLDLEEQTFFYEAHTAEQTVHTNGTTQFKFPLYHYSEFNYEFKISGGDHYELTSYDSEYSSVNKDESGAQYIISQTTERRTLEDLQTQDKSSFLGAVNELKQSAYTHPSSHPASMIVQDSTHRFVTDAEKSTWNGKASPTDIPFKETGGAIWETKDANAEITIPNLYVSKTLILDPETNTHQYVSISEIADDAYTAFLNVTDMKNEKLAPPVTVTVGTTSDTGLSRKQWLCDFHCTGTDDHLVIQQAIDALPSCGGKIVLLEGTYNIGGTITINKNNVTLEGMGVGATKLTSSSNQTCIQVTKPNAHIHDFSMAGLSGIGIWCSQQAANAHIHNMSITDSNSSAITFAGNYGEYNLNIHDIYINTYGGISGGGGFNKIHDCRFGTSCHNPISISGSFDGGYNLIYNNTMNICSGTGINVGGKYCVVSGNIILMASNGNSSISISGTNNLVTGNVMLRKNYINSGGETNTFINNKFIEEVT